MGNVKYIRGSFYEFVSPKPQSAVGWLIRLKTLTVYAWEILQEGIPLQLRLSEYTGEATLRLVVLPTPRREVRTKFKEVA